MCWKLHKLFHLIFTAFKLKWLLLPILNIWGLEGLGNLSYPKCYELAKEKQLVCKSSNIKYLVYNRHWTEVSYDSFLAVIVISIIVIYVTPQSIIYSSHNNIEVSTK